MDLLKAKSVDARKSKEKKSKFSFNSLNYVIVNDKPDWCPKEATINQYLTETWIFQIQPSVMFKEF